MLTPSSPRVLLTALVLGLLPAVRVGEVPGTAAPLLQEAERAPEDPLRAPILALVNEVYALAFPDVGPDAAPLLERLGELQRMARPWTEDSGNLLATIENAVAEQLNLAGHRTAALQLLAESLDWKTSETEGELSDWMLYLATSERLENLAHYRCLAADRIGSVRALGRAEQLLERARGGAFQEREPVAEEREESLRTRSLHILQNRVDAELSFGWVDRAARSMERLEQTFEPRLEVARAGGATWDVETLDGLYFVRRLRLRLLLALDRPESALAAMGAWRAAGELERLRPEQRGSLALLEAMARFEQERVGNVEFAEASPFGVLLEDSAFETLEPADRLRALVQEAARCVELGRKEQADLRIAEFLEQSTAFAANATDVSLQVLGLRLRRLHLELDAGGSLDPGRLEPLRTEFARLCEPLGGAAAAELGSTFLYFGAGTELLSELVEVELAAAPGEAGRRRGLEHVLAVQELGGLAARLGLRPRAGGSSEAGRVKALADLAGAAGVRALVVVPGRNQSRAFLVGAEGCETYELARAGRIERARARLEEELSAFVGLGSRARIGPVNAAAAELSEFLLPKRLREELERFERLAIVGPGALGYVPYELLELRPGEPLGLALAVHYWPSARVAEHLAARPPGPAPALDLLLLARTTLDGDPRGFDLARGELERLAAPFEARHRQVLWGAQVTQARLASADAHALLVVAHGERPNAEREASGLRIPGAADEPILHADSALWGDPGLQVPPLVWLGACSAWQGPFRRGDDGTTHLPSRFLEHGARSVVLPFFELRFDDLSVLASRTTASLLADPERSVADALRLARVDAVERAEDDLGRIAPLLLHELGGPSPRLELSSDTRSFERLARHGVPRGRGILLGLGLLAIGLCVAGAVAAWRRSEGRGSAA